MAILIPWPLTNLTMYGTPPIYAVLFSIADGVESPKISLLVKAHT